MLHNPGTDDGARLLEDREYGTLLRGLLPSDHSLNPGNTMQCLLK